MNKRKNFVQKHIREIFILIAIVFIAGIFFAYWNPGQTGTVLKINKKKISYDEFIRSYHRALENLRDSREEPLSEEETQSLKQDILSRMAQDELILQEANKNGIIVSDEVLAATIRSMPVFQREKNFDKNLYFNVLKLYYRMPRHDFEEETRKSIKRQFMRECILSAVKITPREITGEFAQRFPDEKPTEEKLREFSQTLLNEKRSLIYYTWMTDLFNRSTIINKLPEIEKTASD